MTDTVKIKFPVRSGSNLSEGQIVAAMVEELEKLGEIGCLSGSMDNYLDGYSINRGDGSITATVRAESLADPAKLSSVGGQYVGSALRGAGDAPEGGFTLKDREFSAQSINERLRYALMDPKMRFRMTLMDYKRYYKQKTKELEKSPARMNTLKNLFLTDLMGMFNEILPSLAEGKQLATLVGMNNVTKGLNSVSRELSMAYKRALRQTKQAGQISKNVLVQLRGSYANFLNMLLPQVFPGMPLAEQPGGTDDKNHPEAEGEHSVAETEEEGKTFSDGSTVLRVETKNPDKLRGILRMVDNVWGKGHGMKVTVESLDGSARDSMSFGDGEDGSFVRQVSSETSSRVVYSFTGDGRARLF